jgi:serine/threonine protein kinase
MTLPGAAPAHLGRYELLARLATGGMGEIFLARLEGAAGFEKLFAIKRILPHLAGDLRFRGMLIAEAQLASLMAHANICHVYELGETDGQLYIVMEYLEGITMLPLLRKLSKDGVSLELGFIAGVIEQASEALHYAHELNDHSGENLGIVHRDVTPSNLFVTDAGIVKVLDFGIAKVKNASAHTQTGTVKGKYAYMAPEQLRGAAVDRRADVFALGVVLYEMLALRRLFQRKTDYLTFRAVMEQPIIDVRRYRPDCPDPLAAALAVALDREPTNRFETARALGSAVTEAIRPVQRPWTQGEIGNLVRLHFAHNIHKRSVQIASAVRGGSARQTMPLIAQPDEETLETEGVQEFPPIDSPPPMMAVPPADPRYRRGPSGEQSAQGDPDPNAPQLDALRGVQAPGSQQQPIVVLKTRRSVLWPLLAFAMVGVAAGALFLVWRQQPTLVVNNGSNSRVIQTAPNEVRVEANRGESPPSEKVAEPPFDTGSSDPGARMSGQPPAADRATKASTPRKRSPGESAKIPDAEPAKPPPPDPAVQKAIDGMQSAVSRCEKRNGIAPAGTAVVITLAADGHVKSIAIKPVALGGTALGACITTAFRTVVFPHGPGDVTFEVKLKRPA